MPARAYKVVDVFTSRPLLGNPVAVVLDADGLDDASMQAVARWTNLSETTFLTPPRAAGADYRLRIFTPGGELPFAGHPTLGSAHAALEAGRVALAGGRLTQECAAGLVPIAVAGVGPGRTLTFTLPRAELAPLGDADLAACDAALGAAALRDPRPAILDVGPVWAVAEFASAAAVYALEPDQAACAALSRRLGLTGVTVYGPHPAGGPAAIEVRSFAPAIGAPEDPVCGSCNGAVAAFRLSRGRVAPGDAYLAAQGGRVGRDGRIAVAVGRDGAVTVGGACVTCVDGVLVI